MDKPGELNDEDPGKGRH